MKHSAQFEKCCATLHEKLRDENSCSELLLDYAHTSCAELTLKFGVCLLNGIGIFENKQTKGESSEIPVLENSNKKNNNNHNNTNDNKSFATHVWL